MDELLYSRLKQLREIEERLSRIPPTVLGKTVNASVNHLCAEITQLRSDVLLMIANAEEEYRNF